MACKTKSDQETASLGNVGFLEPARKAVRPSMRSLAFLPPLPSAKMATAAPPPDTQEGRSLVRVRPSALECTTATNLAVARIGVDWRIFQIGGSGEKCHFATIWQRGASQGCETDHGCQRNRSVRQSVLGRRSGSRLIATYSLIRRRRHRRATCLRSRRHRRRRPRLKMSPRSGACGVKCDLLAKKAAQKVA